MPKFIHAADLHLDSPMRGLSRYEGAPENELRLATREALKNLVRLAGEEEVDFVLIAGDVYDGDWKDYNTGLFFAAQMSLLREMDIPVVMISGNHDAESQITKSLTLPSNVTRLSARKPETKIFEACGVAIHGQSFPTRAVDYDLTPNYPAAEPHMLNIGLLHTLAEGQEGHDRYAPCTLDGLRAKGYDYWALGHVHTRAVLNAREPHILFPGNIQGRHARETEGKGCTVVTCDDGQILETQHRDLNVVDWACVQIDATPAASEDEVLHFVRVAMRERLRQPGEKLIAARIEVYGATRAHPALMLNAERFTNEVRSIATDEGGGQIWIEKVKLLTTACRSAQSTSDGGTPMGRMLHSIATSACGEAMDENLKEELAALQEKLPSELTSGNEKIDLRDRDQLAALFDGARGMLLSKLQSEWARGK